MSDIQTSFRGRRGLMKKVADALGITQGAVSQWRRVPAGRVLDVERVTGISRHVLRPDLYPVEALPVSSADASREIEKKAGDTV